MSYRHTVMQFPLYIAQAIENRKFDFRDVHATFASILDTKSVWIKVFAGFLYWRLWIGRHIEKVHELK